MINFIKSLFKKEPKTFFTSDLHVGHLNVIQYCNRPYKTIEEMNEAILKIWNKTVSKNDIVYVLGDFSLNTRYVEMYLPKMNGEKRLIVGNHDSCFETKLGQKKEKTAKMKKRYYEAGFKTIQTSHMMKIDKYGVELSHFPFAPKANDDKSSKDVRYMNERPIDKGQILLHGHSHAYHRKNGRMIDVGFDGDLKLWSEAEIIKLIEDPRDYIPSPITEYYKSNKEKLIVKKEKN